MKISKFFKKIKNIFYSKEFIILIVILMACSWSLSFRGLGLGHDTNHEARIFEIAEGIKSGHFPVIWSQNFAYGYGMPLFEFYAPLPYYLGAIFYLIGFNLGQSVEILIILAHVTTILGAYLLTKEIFQNKSAALISSMIIGMAPYRAVNLSIRFAISEGWAISFIIYAFLGVIFIVKKKKFGIALLSFSFASLLLSHNITTILATPFLIIFGLSSLIAYYKNIKELITQLISLTAAGILGFGLSAFYSIPAFLEKNFTKVDILVVNNFFSYHQHFLYIRQFFEPWGKWEYGGSGWGPNDEMSFFLGYGQILILFVAIIMVLVSLLSIIRKKKIEKNHFWLFSILGLYFATLALTLLKAEKIWDLFWLSKYFQFPWRLLSINLIFGGLLGSCVYQLLPKKAKDYLFVIVFMLLVGMNTRYFQSEKYNINNHLYENYSEYIKTTQSRELFDYLPAGINFFEKIGFFLYKNPEFENIESPVANIIQNPGNIFEIKILENKVNYKKAIIYSKDNSIVNVNLAFFPGWKVFANNAEVNVIPNVNGLISFELPSGYNEVEIEFTDTTTRVISKQITLLSLFLILILILKGTYAPTHPKSSSRHPSSR